MLRHPSILAPLQLNQKLLSKCGKGQKIWEKKPTEGHIISILHDIWLKCKAVYLLYVIAFLYEGVSVSRSVGTSVHRSVRLVGCQALVSEGPMKTWWHDCSVQGSQTCREEEGRATDGRTDGRTNWRTDAWTDGGTVVQDPLNQGFHAGRCCSDG